jgi:hypothetical protein
MKLLQKSRKTGQRESVSPAGTEEQYRRLLRLRAERDDDRNLTGEKDK